MIGNTPLSDFTRHKVNTPNPEEIYIAWRDTSPSYYLLRTESGLLQHEVFVDFSNGLSDIPDLHFIGLVLPIGLGVEADVIVDRFGNWYAAVSPSFMSIGAGVYYAEGYVLQGHTTPRTTYTKLDENALMGTIAGKCVALSVMSDWGLISLGCSSNRGIICAGAGIVLNMSVGLSITFEPFHSDPSTGWDWVIEDRVRSGITEEAVCQVLCKMGQVPVSIRIF